MIPHVVPGVLITATNQNDLIDQVNENTEDIEGLLLASGDPDSVQGLIDESIEEHSLSQNPHPTYDDIPSLNILFENGLV